MAESQNVSLVSIVSLGSKLATTLDTTLTAQRFPEDRLISLNADINATVGILRQLHDLVEADKQLQNSGGQVTVLKDAGLQEIRRRAAQCEVLYRTIIAVITKAGMAGWKNNIKTEEIDTSVLKATSISRDLHWTWLRPRIKKSVEQLEVIKMNLLLILQVGALAKHQVCVSPRVPGMFEEELALRILVERLKRRRYRRVKGLAKKYHVSPPRTANSSVIELGEPFLTRDDKVLLRLCRRAGPGPIPWNQIRTEFHEEVDLLPDVAGLQAWFNRLEMRTKGRFVDLSNVLKSDEKKDEIEVSPNSDKIEVVVGEVNKPPPYTESSAADKVVPIIEKAKPTGSIPPPPPPSDPMVTKEKIDGASKDVEVVLDAVIQDKAKDVEIITMSAFKQQFGKVDSWFKELFGPSSLFFDDKESDSLEAFMILGNKGRLRVPFGHRRLKFGLKKMMKVKKTSTLDDYAALPKHLHEAIHHVLHGARVKDSRDRLVICFDVLKLGEKQEDQHLLVFMSRTGPPLEHVQFKDAVGRRFSVPYFLIISWDDMKDFVNSAFDHIETIGPMVRQGSYDIISEDGEIILPKCWGPIIKPGMKISMSMWPLPDNRPPPPRPYMGPPRPFGCGPPPRPGPGPGPGYLPPPGGPPPFRPMPPIGPPRGPAPPIIVMNRRRSYSTISSSSSRSTDRSSINSCSDIENEECDLGIKFDYDAEKFEATVQVKDLLEKWTNALDVEGGPLSSSSYSSNSGNSSDTSLVSD